MGDSFYLNLRATGPDWSTPFQPPIRCPVDVISAYNHNGQLVETARKEWEIALAQCSYTNLIPNVRDGSEFNYHNGTEEKTIMVPYGHYSVLTLNSYLMSQMKNNGDFIPIDGANDVFQEEYYVKILPFFPTGRVRIDVTAPYTVDITWLAELLGFTTAVLGPGIHYGDKAPTFALGLDRFYIRSSLVGSGSYNNDEVSDILYSFIPNVEASGIMNVAPEQRVYLPFDEPAIYQLRMRLTDKSNKIIPVESAIQYVIHLRRRLH